MPGRRMSRPTYRQPNGAIRTDAYRHSDSAIELDYYHRQLEKVHGSGLHGWGVADGLRVTATQNSPNLKIEPGVAIDKDGQHISLAEGGTAEIGWQPDVPGTAPMPAAVNADGAVVPTAGLSGDFYVTITFWETYEDGQYRYQHTPWIQLVPVNGFADDGSRIVLARVTLDPAGQVTGLTYGPRRQALLPTGGIELRRPRMATPTPNFAVDNTPAAEILPRDGGGLRVRVPNSGDQIEIEQGPNLNWWGMNAANNAVRLGAISARFGATAGGGSSGALAISTKETGGDVVEALRISDRQFVGVGTTTPNARLSVVAPGSSEILGTAPGSTFRTSSGNLGTSAGAELPLVSFGFNSANHTSLGIRARRVSNGTGWETTSIGLGIDVDNTLRVNMAAMWLLANANVGIGTPTPGARLDVSGSGGASQCCAPVMPTLALSEASSTAARRAWLQFHNAGEAEAYLRLTGGGPAGSGREGPRRFEIGDNQGVNTGLSVQGSLAVGTTNQTSRLHVAGNGGILSLEGADHAYIQWYPRGIASRRAWTGFGGANTNAFNIMNDSPNEVNNPGRMHIYTNEHLYFLPGGQTFVSRAWGGTGDLIVEGRIGVAGQPPQPRTRGWGGGIHTWDIEVEGTAWSRNGWQTGARDLAENFETLEPLKPGVVVSFHRDQNAVVQSTVSNDTLVCGVVSTQPGVLLNADADAPRFDDIVPIALCGRVPCQVVDENGPIQRGDLLTSSSIPGYAMRAAPVSVDGEPIYRSGTIVGKALESHDRGRGVITIFVSSR